MAVEVIRDLIKVEQVIGEELAQTMVEGDFVVSDEKPDLNRILAVDGRVTISGKEALQDRVVVEGSIKFTLLYISDEKESPLCSIEVDQSFTQNVELPGVKPKMNVRIKGTVEHIDYGIINSRKFKANAVLNLDVKVTNVIQLEVVKKIEGVEDIQVLSDNIKVTDVIGEGTSQTMVKEDIELPDDKPLIDNILYSQAQAVVRDKRTMENRVVVEGEVNLKTLYVADDDDKSINYVQHSIPFSQFVQVDGALENMDCEVEASVDEVYSSVRENAMGEATILAAEAVVGLWVRVCFTEDIQAVMDAYSPTRNLEIGTKDLKIVQMVGQGDADVVIKESIDIPSEVPEVSKVYSIDARPMITDHKIGDDRVIVEGILGINMLYMAANSEQLVHNYAWEVPFRHFIPFDGIAQDMEADLTIDTTALEYNVIAPDEVEVKTTLRASAVVTRQVEKKVILTVKEAEGEQQPQELSSITIYYVKEGDILWDIAKRFNTTVEDILKTNEIEDQEKLDKGKPILIYRRKQYKLA
ncbi:MAG TPA: DUF3794 domain-containing protein [Clostridiales bacterium]|nr:DUF3794 domain-containing protein [Clostridiales bacterium]